MPVTVTVLSGASAASSTADTVTRPVLTVAPAAIVSVAGVLRMKSPACAFAPGAADTVSVEGSDEGCVSTAVIVATPPLSDIDDADSTSAASGAASSSMTARDAGAGPRTAPALDARPDTDTALSGPSVASSTAVTVTTPVLTVAPAAIVSVAGVLRTKSPARVPAPGAAATATVVATSAG